MAKKESFFLSKDTIKTFTYLSNVNQYLIIKENSNFLSVFNNDLAVNAQCIIPEVFPKTFGLDWVKFYGIFSILIGKDEDESGISLEFLDNNTIKMHKGGMEASLVSVAVSSIFYSKLLDKTLSFDKKSLILQVDLTEEDLKTIKKAASVLSVDSIVLDFTSSNSCKVHVKEYRSDNPTYDVFSINKEPSEQNDYDEVGIKLENLLLMAPGKYSLEVYSTGTDKRKRAIVFEPDQENKPKIRYTSAVLFK